MPYKSREKKREYQRKWLSKKVKNKDGSIRLVGSHISWEQLKSIDQIPLIKTWEECVRRASVLSVNKKIDRMLMAELAIRACVIRHGGDFSTDDYKKGKYGKTLIQFARESGIHPKTLGGWISVKRYILDRIEDKEDSLGIDVSTAQLALKACSIRSGDDPLLLYQEMALDPVRRQCLLVMKYVKTSHDSVRRNIKILTKAQKKVIIGFSENVINLCSEKG